MKKNTIVSIFCTLGWLLAAYAAYAYVYFVWLSATPLTESQLKRVQYDARIWLVVFGISIIAAPLLGWWRFRLAGLLSFSKKEPNQAPEPTAPSGRGSA